MPDRKRIQMTYETSEVVILRGLKNSASVWCEPCNAKAVMLPIEAAAMLASADVSVLYEATKSGSLHATETLEGLQLVCLPSLFENFIAGTGFT